MKADKAFYNTLRAEVSQGEVKHALCLFAKYSHEVNEKGQALPNTQTVEELQERIKGLQSQVELLEKRNQELTEKNKELEARAYPDYSTVEYEMTDEDIDEMIQMQEDFEKAQAAQYRRGYISLKEIAKWGNEGTANVGESRLIKEMIRDIMPVMTEEEKELVKNIGADYKKVQPQLPPIDKVNQFNLMTGSNPQASYTPDENR